MSWTNDPDSWSRSLGKAWGIALKQSALDPEGVVVEIGPGFTVKVGLGLLDAGFHGTILLVEPNGEARSWARWRYEEILPKAKILASEAPVPRLAAAVTGPVDVLAANHILDDLLLGACLSPSERNHLFAQMQPEGPVPPHSPALGVT